MDRCVHCGAALYGAWCGQCFAPATLVPAVAGSVSATPVLTAAPVCPKDAEGRIAGPLAAILLLGALVQGGLWLYSRNTDNEVAAQLRFGQWVILGFYAAVLAVVVRMARRVDFAPIWSSGPTAENVAIGALKGVATASVILGLHSLGTGRVQVAPSVKFELGDATVASILIALLGLVVAAPVVEELLFRGFAAESMRHRGERVALVVSGVLFALWHMRLGGIAYYTVMGVVLGRSYFKRGLASSMAAHAGFNGTLAVVAIVFIVGPGSVMGANGVRVHAPGGWDEIDTQELGLQAQFAAHGPSSAVFYVVHETVPAGDIEPAEVVEFIETSGGVGVPGITAVAGTARVVHYPAGSAVRLRVTAQGRDGELALFHRGTSAWTVALEHGTDRSRADFEEMLETLELGDGP